MDEHCDASSRHCELKGRHRHSASDLDDALEFALNEEPMHDCEGDDDNQDDSELLLADDDDRDFNELAAETSSLGSSDSSGFVCSEDQRTFTAVRVRPMLPLEKKNGYRAIIDMTVTSDGLMTRIVNPTALPPPPRGHTSARYTSSKPPVEESTSATDSTMFPAQFTQEFRFDYTYWSFDRSPRRPVATQSTIYDELGVLALQQVLQGSNCSVFAYGQPSAGKTYSLMGSSGERASLPASVRTNGNVNGVRTPSALSASERRGLIPRICQGLFAEIDEGKSSGSSYTVVMSYVEIYDERVYDLLSRSTMKKSLKVREHPDDGAFVERARRVHVTSSSQVVELIGEGNRTRSVSSSRPSRSHTVLLISLSQSSQADAAPRTSKLAVVDLAASERVDRSDVSGLRAREAASVNRSLATLADVVGALAKRRSGRSVDGSQPQKVFAPYRNSVLTRLLRDCLGGHAKTIMLGTISPCCAHYDESMATLRYIERARSVYSTVRIPETCGDMTQQLMDDAGELKSTLPSNDVSSVCCGAPEHHEDCLDCNCNEQRTSNDDFAGSLDQDMEQKAVVNEQVIDVEVEKQVDSMREKQISKLELQTSASLLNLVAIRRRFQALCKYRALNRWRKYASSLHGDTTGDLERKSQLRGLGGQSCYKLSPLKSIGRKAGYPPLHNRAPTAGLRAADRAQDVVAAVVAADAICCSVVQDFLFPDQPPASSKPQPSTIASTASLLELLASSSEFDRSGFRFDCTEDCSENYHQLEELASPENWCSGDEEEFNLPSDLDITGVDEEYTTPRDGSGASPSLSPEIRSGESCMQSTLSLCVDSIDMARRALGPGLHSLRGSRSTAGGTGVECELLQHLDKKFITMTRSFEDAVASPPPHSSQSCYELLEPMVGEFCLQIIAKLCDQLPSAASACVAGRLQLETQLEHFSDRLRQLLPELTRSGDSINIVKSRERYTAFDVATELLVMTERIKLVWDFAGQRKRERLLQMRAVEAAAIRDRQVSAKMATLEERNAELSARCKTLAATSGRLEVPSSRIPNHSTITLEQLERDCDAMAVLKSGDNLGSKLAVEVARTRDVQARNDELLCRFATLNRALAAASARVTALEAENSRLNCGVASTYSANSSGNTVVEALNDRISTLQKELDYARDNAPELESQLTALQRVNAEQIFKLERVQAQLSHEEEARKQASALVADLKHQLARTETQAKEMVAAESVKHEKRWQATNASLSEVQAVNAQLSAELIEVKSELRTALERANQVHDENMNRVMAIENLKESLRIQEEIAEMCTEDALAAQHALRRYISAQANQIAQLELRVCLDSQSQHELETKLVVAVQGRDEHVLLLSRAEEALANALERENTLRSQLEAASARALEEVNRVRAELHESTIEVASLREELAELLDHSTLQSATIDQLKLEQAETLDRCQQLELELDEQALQRRAREEAAAQRERTYQELVERSAGRLSRLERQLEIEHQECMATNESLQRQAYTFNKSQIRQHSIKMNYCSTIQDLKAQLDTLSTELTEETNKTKETQSQNEALERLASKFMEQLQECRIDLKACSQRWIRAETQCVLLRISSEHLKHSLAVAQDLCNMQQTDVESSQLTNDQRHSATPEAVKEQLSSLDAWFDEVISSNQTTTELQDQEPHKAQDEDDAERSSLLKTLTDLSALTNELLVVCEAAPQVKPRTERSSSNDKDNEARASKQHTELHQGKTSSLNEVAQLRKIVMKLKDALDAKDDMLLYLDGKVKRLEQIASK